MYKDISHAHHTQHSQHSGILGNFHRARDKKLTVSQKEIRVISPSLLFSDWTSVRMMLLRSEVMKLLL